VNEQRTHWLALFGMFIATIVINVLVFAYGYGQLDHRVQVLEERSAQLREEWKDARARIESALKER
jgi:hypothetical protein